MRSFCYLSGSIHSGTDPRSAGAASLRVVAAWTDPEELLYQVLFWNTLALEHKLSAFRPITSVSCSQWDRRHSPAEQRARHPRSTLPPRGFRWAPPCHGLFPLPAAAYHWLPPATGTLPGVLSWISTWIPARPGVCGVGSPSTTILWMRWELILNRRRRRTHLAQTKMAMKHTKFRARMIDRGIMVLSASLVMTWAFAAVPGEPEISKPPPIPAENVPQKKPSSAAPEITPTRGQMLYENHCIACHQSTAHIRRDRRANSLKALEGWVIRWSNQQQLNWSTEDVGDVVDYLNNRYYKFPRHR